MSGEEQFQLLISNQDYLNLQSKCNQLEALCQKLTTQSKDYSLKIFDLKEQNEALLARNVHTDQSIRKLQNQSQSLSAQIAELQSMLEKTMSEKRKMEQQKEGIKKEMSEVSKMKEKQIQALRNDLNNLQKVLDESKKQLLDSKQKGNMQREENKLLKQQIDSLRNEMKQKSEQINYIKSECDIMLSNLNKCKQENQRKSKQNQMVLDELKTLQRQLMTLAGELKAQQRLNEQMKIQKQRQINEKIALQKEGESLRDKLMALSKVQQQYMAGKKFKQSTEEELKIKIVELQAEVIKQKKNSEVIEKQYEEIISSLEKQKKLLETQLKLQFEPKPKPSSRLNDKTQKDQLQQIKTRLEQYFTNLAVNLYEVGNLDQQDIKGILVQQEEIVKSYVTDITAPFVIKKERGPPQFHRY